VELLEKLCRTAGPAGQEERVRDLVKGELTPLVDEVRTDTLGNLIGFRKGRGDARVMCCAHMDEIGFVVSHVDKEGFIRFLPVGGFDPRTLVTQRVIVLGRRDVTGVIGVKPIHILSEEEKKKVPEIKNLFIDLGLPVDEVRETVAVGDRVVLEREFADLGPTVTGKCFDDRVGIYVMIEALKRIKTSQANIFPVATVQEEVGLRGALVSAYGVEPDLGLAIDVTIANDIPGADEHEWVSRLGSGTAIKVMDSSSISSARLVDYLRELAEKEKIAYQMEILPRGGTDAGALQRVRAGVEVATLSIPTRHVHSSVEMCHKEDIEATIRLLAAFLSDAHNFTAADG
jgi:endoglucanase